MIVPYEILYEIYAFADMSTRININRAFNISYKIANPLSRVKIRKLYIKKYSPFNFIMRGH